jgi:hypothetical protein
MTIEAPPHAEAQFVDLLRTILPYASPLALGLLLLESDAHASRLSMRERHQLVVAALRDGRERAEGIGARSRGREPATLAQEMGVALSRVQSDSRCGDHLYFADYHAKPPSIRLFDSAISRINRYLRCADTAMAFGLTDAAPVFIAHELYHHFDATGPDSIIRRHRVTILKVGSWKLTSGISSLAEIGAGAFAQRLLGLPLSPSLFDLIARFDEDPRRALAMAEAILSIRAHFQA